MVAAFEVFSADKVCVFLKEQVPSLSDSIFHSIKENKIDGEVFLALNDKYLREIAPLIGDRLKIKRAINTALSAVSSFSFV